MSPTTESEITDPLENLKKFFYAIVAFILLNIQNIVLILFAVFLIILAFLLGFFKLLGF